VFPQLTNAEENAKKDNSITPVEMRKFVITFSLCLFQALVHARLGETQDQAEIRYGLPKSEKVAKFGRPLIEGGKELTFEYEGWRIRCALLKATDGKEYIVREEYRKIWNSKSYKDGGSPKITDFEREAVLNGEAGTSGWSKKLHGDLGRNPLRALSNQLAHISGLSGTVWTRDDGAVARLDGSSTAIVLDLPQARKYEIDLKAIREQKAREGVPKF
jgi:hypothetical protein